MSRLLHVTQRVVSHVTSITTFFVFFTKCTHPNNENIRKKKENNCLHLCDSKKLQIIHEQEMKH